METETETKTENEPSIESYHPKRNYWEFGIFVSVVIVLASTVLVLGFLVLQSFSNPSKGKASIQDISKTENQGALTNKTEKKVEETAKPAESNVQPSKTINPLETAVKILNGGAAGGSAGKVKDILTSKGYKKVEAGNSEKSNYAGVTVFYQADTKTVAEKVLADLKAKYPTAQIKLGVSSEEKSAPVVIILGK